MPKIRYIESRIRQDRLQVIAQANAIIEEYAAQGFTLTLRQLYYQFVARDLIANTPKEYSRLGDTISDGRLAGLIDWNAIIDRSRGLKQVAHWSEPASIMQSAAHSFRLDKWEDQQYRPEVWIEKDALVGVIEDICTELDVPYFSCRGYTSQTEMWNGAMRLLNHTRKGQWPLILHFGDHDPSGMDMTRDITDRLELFMGGMEIRRLALNTDQVDQFHPPPNPAKVNDPRAKAYIAEFGHESWELDALEPAVLVELIRTTVESFRDQEAWDAKVEEEERHRARLLEASRRWEQVTRFLER